MKGSKKKKKIPRLRISTRKKKMVLQKPMTLQLIHPYKGFERDKDQKACHEVINNLSHDSACESYLDINSGGLVHSGRWRSRESMSGILLKEIWQQTKAATWRGRVKQTVLVGSHIKIVSDKSVKFPLKSNWQAFLSSQESSFKSFWSNKLQIREIKIDVLTSKKRGLFTSHDKNMWQGQFPDLEVESWASGSTVALGARLLFSTFCVGHTWCFRLSLKITRWLLPLEADHLVCKKGKEAGRARGKREMIAESVSFSQERKNFLRNLPQLLLLRFLWLE